MKRSAPCARSANASPPSWPPAAEGQPLLQSLSDAEDGWGTNRSIAGVSYAATRCAWPTGRAPQPVIAQTGVDYASNWQISQPVVADDRDDGPPVSTRGCTTPHQRQAKQQIPQPK